MSYSSSYRLYHSYIVECLHGRPPAIVKYVLQRLQNASDYTRDQVTGEKGVFQVLSQDYHSVVYNGNCIMPQCSCQDIRRPQLTYKHFCAGFLLVDGWDFFSLPFWYREVLLMSPHRETSEVQIWQECHIWIRRGWPYRYQVMSNQAVESIIPNKFRSSCTKDRAQPGKDEK